MHVTSLKIGRLESVTTAPVEVISCPAWVGWIVAMEMPVGLEWFLQVEWWLTRCHLAPLEKAVLPEHQLDSEMRLELGQEVELVEEPF